jgi:hypothetical protein
MNTPNKTDLEIQKRNFRYVQIDAFGVSISNVAAPFLPVFLARLGASNFQSVYFLPFLVLRGWFLAFSLDALVGRAHVLTSVTADYLVFRFLL